MCFGFGSRNEHSQPIKSIPMLATSTKQLCLRGLGTSKSSGGNIATPEHELPAPTSPYTTQASGPSFTDVNDPAMPLTNKNIEQQRSIGNERAHHASLPVAPPPPQPHFRRDEPPPYRKKDHKRLNIPHQGGRSNRNSIGVIAVIALASVAS